MREGSFETSVCRSSRELVALLGERKTKCACIVDSSESTRKRMEGLLHKFIPLPQAIKIPDAKGSSGQGMGETREDTGLAADESQKQT